jgi:hypothetical protein
MLCEADILIALGKCLAYSSRVSASTEHKSREVSREKTHKLTKDEGAESWSAPVMHRAAVCAAAYHICSVVALTSKQVVDFRDMRRISTEDAQLGSLAGRQERCYACREPRARTGLGRAQILRSAPHFKVVWMQDEGYTAVIRLPMAQSDEGLHVTDEGGTAIIRLPSAHARPKFVSSESTIRKLKAMLAERRALGSAP